MVIDFSLLNFTNFTLYAVVFYALIIRANLMHGEKFWVQKLPICLLVIGVMYNGLAPFSYKYSIVWQDLFLPLGLAMFFLRHVHRVEKFYVTNHGNGD